jgi:NAD(P)-dependent dehydrogenase (short-subunit alcohol dehydrogenase family)
MKDRIAVVSGAGSGLGRSIATGLARAGAVVGLVDVDAKGAQATAGLIRKDLPEAQVLVIGCDVTDEADVSRAFAAVLEEWGGLDILVNAAGIAPAGPLVDMPADKWRAALEVNLTGYFLMGREAARIMIRQGMGGSIINLSSKSGIEASKDNTAYNATKAGEIHIARGWALELGQYGIRVNSVAPGNVFEGSKIWNAEYMKVCARKYGIKPDEVIPYYVSKTALNREITGRDVADAVVFLCSDKARTITGQTLVPDSGQVMVR